MSAREKMINCHAAAHRMEEKRPQKPRRGAAGRSGHCRGCVELLHGSHPMVCWVFHWQLLNYTKEIIARESPDICPASKSQENNLPEKSAQSIYLEASQHSASKKRPISTQAAVPVAL